MSTRSMIARKTEEGFQGVYHHWDGYPSALGHTLWQLYHQGDRNLNGMLALLIDEHPAGWSSINGVDWDQPIGYVTDYAKGRETNAPQCFCVLTIMDHEWQSSRAGLENRRHCRFIQIRLSRLN